MNRYRCSGLAASFLLAALAACGTVASPGDDDGDGDNQPPVATSAELSTYMVTPIRGRLSAEDPDGNPLTFAVVDQPTGGQLELDPDGSFVYTPARGTSGADSFTFVVDDSRDTSDQATVDISIATLTDGTPDATFGDDGATISDFGESDGLSGVTVQDDGRIAAVGNSASEWAVVAGYSTRGAVLSPWGEGGSGTTMINFGDYDGFGDVVQQPDGRLVSVGQTQDGANRQFLLLGLTDNNGYLDSSFNGSGYNVTDVVAGQIDVANAMAVLPDGGLLVAGYASNGTNDDFAVARYSKDGVLDGDFGTGGTRVVDLGGFERVNDVAVDGDGNILLVGEANNDMGVVRLTSEGDPDASFGDDGTLTLDRGENDEAVGVVVGADGAIYVGGTTQDGGVSSMAVARLTPAGELDASFGEEGWGLATAPTADAYANDMILLPNDTLLLVGGWITEDVTEAAAARIDLAGHHDPLFGTDGFYHQAIGSGGDDELSAVALQPDGKVVAAGSSKNATFDSLLIRLGW